MFGLSAGDAHPILEYYFARYFIIIIDLFKNSTIQKIIYSIIYDDPKTNTKLYSLCDHKYLSNHSYNRPFEINGMSYTILKFNLDTQPIQMMAKQCLENIIHSKKVRLNNIPITIDDCVIVDVLNTSLIKFNSFHTDIEYSNYNGNAFNVWYLIENNENYGNLFLLETSEYKKEYTPCFLSDDYTDNLIPMFKKSYVSELIKNYKKIGHINQDSIKITYTDMKNGECLIMSKHLIHRTDLSRKNNLKGFNFRVIIKNKDGSIDYKNKYNKVKPYHVYDEKNNKIHGCKLMDFI